MKSNNVMSQVSFLAEAPSASLTNTRFESRMNPFVPVDTEDPVKGFVAVTALKLARRDLLDFTDRGHLGHLSDERVIIVNVLDCIDRLKI